jgi:hypothetical protein
LALDSVDRIAPIHEADFVDLGPDGRGSSAWLVSLLLHLSLLIVFSLLTTTVSQPVATLLLSSSLTDEPLEIPKTPAEEFQVQIDPAENIGANSLADDKAAVSRALEIGEPTDIATPDLKPFDYGELEFRQLVEPVRGLEMATDHLIKGSAGFGVTGAEGAVDRITQEILVSLEERKTLVVWFFDQSASLIRQREVILKRFDRIYEELGVIEKSGSSRFAKHDVDALLTLVVAFGKDVTFPIKKPTSNYSEIKKAVDSIARDDSGEELVFTAIQKSVTRVKQYRRDNERGEPDRNVLFVVFTDEAGDDQELLDQTTKMCVNLAIPVYIVGVPAPFGRVETEVKWVDPDPKYSQRPQKGRVTQGPESLLPERIRLSFSKSQDVNMQLDSGFGPFALTRLARESGGQYFAVHANRDDNGYIRWKDVPAYSSHLQAFFDEDVMRHYRPDYVSAEEYKREVNASNVRRALVTAALESQNEEIPAMVRPRTRFVKRDEAALANALSDAQRTPASLEQTITRLLAILKTGERDREKEAMPRWQAGFDLAIGRTLAANARTVGYNLMLAEVKRGKKFQNPKNNTWVLLPSKKVSVGTQIANDAAKAEEYLTRVVREHTGTPWAYLAQVELGDPLGWEWSETYTAPPPSRNAIAAADAANNNQPTPEDERRRMLERQKTRPVPKL